MTFRKLFVVGAALAALGFAGAAVAQTGAQKAQVGNQAGGRVWLFLETDDLLRDHAAWLAAGVHFRETPRHETYGKVVVVEDLYGNAWDLSEPATGA